MTTYYTTTSASGISSSITNTGVNVSSTRGRFTNCSLAGPGSSTSYATLSGFTPSTHFPSTGWTIEFWFYPTSASNNTLFYTMVRSAQSSNFLEIQITTNSTNVPHVFYKYGNGTTFINNGHGSATPTVLNTWHHFALVFDGSGYRAYVDGRLDTSQTSTTNCLASTTGLMFLGTGNTNNSYTGNLAQFRISATARYTGNSIVLPSASVDSTSALDQYSTYMNTFQLNGASSGSTSVSAGVTVTTGTAPSYYLCKGPFTLTPSNSTNITIGTSNVKFGSCALTNTGTTSYATLNGLYTSDFTSWTVEFWFYITANLTTARQTLFVTSNNHLQIYVDNGPLVVVSKTAASQDYYSSGGLSNGTWYHFALVWTGTDLSHYVNGTRTQTYAHTYNSLGTAATAYMCSTSSQYGLYGSIDDLRISNTARYSGASFTVPTSAFSSSLDLSTFYYNDFEQYGALSGASVYPSGYMVVTSTTYNNWVPPQYTFLSDTSTISVTSVGTWTVSRAQKKYGTTSFYSSATSGTNYIAYGTFYTDYDLPSLGWTIESWFYPTQASSNQIYGLFATNSVYRMNLVSYNSTLMLYLSSNGTSWDIANGTSGTSAAFALNSWNHVALSFDGLYYRVCINGTIDIVVTSSTNITFPNSTIACPGYYNPTGNAYSGYFQGYVDELRVSRTSRYPTTIETVPSSTFRNSLDASTVYVNLCEGTHGSSTLTSSAYRAGYFAAVPTLPTSGAALTSMTKISAALTTEVSKSSPYSGFLSADGCGLFSGVSPSTFANSYTIEGFFYISALTGGDHCIFGTGSTSSSTTQTYGLRLVYNGSVVNLAIGSGGTTYAIAAGTSGVTTLSTKTWYHFALQYDLSTYKVYVDGKLEIAVASATKVPTSLFAFMQLGCELVKTTSGWLNSASFSRKLHGALDDIRISNTARYTTSSTVGATYTIPTSTDLATSDTNSIAYIPFTSAPPSNVVVTLGYKAVTLSWSAPTSGATPTSYTVVYGVTSSLTTTTVSGISGTSTTISGLTSGVSYTFMVSAVSSLGTSSSMSVIATPYGEPDAPTGVTVLYTANSTLAATVSWTAPTNTGATDITGYSVVSSPATTTQTTSGTSMTFTGLIPGITYTFAVAATNSVGTGAYSSASSSITPSWSCSASVTQGNASATVSWSSFTNTNGYSISSYTVSSSPATSTQSASSSSSTSMTFTGLTLGTSYTFTVTAVYTNGYTTTSSSSSSVMPFDSYALSSTSCTISNTAGMTCSSSFGRFSPNCLVTATVNQNFYINNITPSVAFPSTGWTVECWFIYSSGFLGNNNAGYVMGGYAGPLGVKMYDSSGINYIYFQLNSRAITNLSLTNYSVVAGTWNHVALVFTGTQYRLYFQGMLLTTVSSSTNVLSSATTFNFNASTATYTGIVGYYDEIRISNTARYTEGGFELPTTSYANSLDANVYYLNTFPITNAASTTTIHTGYTVAPSVTSSTTYTSSRSEVRMEAPTTVFLTDNTVVKYGNFSVTSTNTTASNKISLGGIDVATAFPSSGWTIELWVYVTNTLSGATTLTLLSGSSTSVLHLTLTTTLGLVAASNSTATTTVSVSGSTTVTASTWNHIAIVYSSSTLYLYLNQALQGSVSNSYNTGNILSVLNLLGGGTNAVQGYLDSVCLSSTARYSGSTYTQPSATFGSNLDQYVYYYNDFEDFYKDSASAQSYLSPGSTASLSTSIAKRSVIQDLSQSQSSNLSYSSTNLSMTLNTSVQKYGSACYYMTGDFVSLTINNVEPLCFPSTGWTIEYWFRPDSGKSSYAIGGAGNFTIALWISAGSVSFSVGNQSSWAFSSTGSGSVTMSAWNHIAITFDGTRVVAWFNGSPSIYVNTSGTNPMLNATLGINGNSLGRTVSCWGYLDDLRVSNVFRYPSVPTASYTSMIDANTCYLNPFESTSSAGYMVNRILSRPLLYNTTGSMTSSTTGSWKDGPMTFSGSGYAVITSLPNMSSYTAEGYFRINRANTATSLSQVIYTTADFQMTTTEFYGFELSAVTTAIGASTFRIYARWSSGSTSYNVSAGTTGTTTFSTGTWYHFVAQVNSPSKLWTVGINGTLELVGGSASGPNGNTPRNMVLGAGFQKSGRSHGIYNPLSYFYPLCGSISVFRVSNTTRYSGSTGASYTVPSIATLKTADSNTVFTYSAADSTVPLIGTASVSASSTSATVTWASDNSGAYSITGYSIISVPTTTTQTVSGSSTTSATFTGLTYGTSYKFYVAGVTSDGTTGTYSSGSNSVTPYTAPDAPVISFVTVGSARLSAIVSWSVTNTNGSTISSYTVISSPATSTVTTSNTYATMTGLTYGQTYAFQVRASSNAGDTSYSSTYSYTHYNVPDAPTIGTASLVASSTTATVTWTAPTDTGGLTITGYSIVSSPATTTQTATAGSTSMEFTGLSNDISYTFTVAAINSLGTGTASSSSNSVTPYNTTPGEPTIGTVTVAGATSITVNWTAPTTRSYGITGYTVSSTPALVSGNQTSASAVATSLTFVGLTTGTSYTFAVAAINTFGTGTYSSASSSIVPGSVPGTPTSVSATAGNTQVIVSWSAPTNTNGYSITGYTIDTTPSGGSTTTTTYSNSTTSATITGLTGGTLYTFAVSATNALGTGTSSSVTATPFSLPTAPTGLTATSGNLQVDLSWTAPSSSGSTSISSYSVQYVPTSGGTTTTLTGISGTSTTVTGLTNGTSYTFTVAAVNSNGTGTSSSSVASTPSTVPGAPTGLTPTVGNGQVSLSWTAPSDNGGATVSSYSVQHVPTSGGTTTTVTGISGTSTTVTGLTNGTSYTFSVAAVNTKGTGTYSSTTTGTPRTTPAAPTGVTATAGTKNTTVAWTAPSNTGGSSITSYQVTYSPGTTITGISSAIRSITISSLTAGTTYTFSVRAVNAAGNGTSSSTVTATPYDIPGTPTALTLTAGVTSIAVSWTAPASNGSTITSYTVQYTPSGGSAQTATVTSGTSTTLTGLVGGTSYTVAVRASNAAGNGSYSTTSSATPRDVPSAPSAPTLSVSIGSTSMGVSWTAPSSNGATITSYTVQYTPSGGSAQTTTVSSGTSTTLTGLTIGTTYSVAVLASNIVGNSSYSTAATATPYDVPGTPSTPTLTAGVKTIAISWTAPSSNGSTITGYTIEYTPSGGSAQTTTATSSPTTLTGLTAETSYSVRILASNAAGDSAYSSSSSATPFDVPSTPTAPNLTAGINSIAVSWTAPSANGSAITGYTVQYTPSGGSAQTTTVTSGTSTTLTGLTAGTSYSVRVLASNIGGDSSYSSASTATPYTYPGAPTSLQATETATSLSLTWSAPSDDGSSTITSYTLYYYTTNPASPTTTTVTTTSKTLTGLTKGTTYTLYVTATNDAGEGASSSSIEGIPSTVPGTPTSLTKTGVDDESVDLSWTAPSDNGGRTITYYTVYCTESSNTTSMTSSSTTTTVTGLTNFVTYDITVTASNLHGEGDASSSIQAMPYQKELEEIASVSENISTATETVTGVVPTYVSASSTLEEDLTSDNASTVVEDYATASDELTTSMTELASSNASLSTIIDSLV